MAGLAVIGAQWGDEGKGKVIDALSAEADAIVRFQGGANAGHTVVVGERSIVLHLIPSGILHPGRLCLIGNGVVIDPDGLLEEVAELERRSVALEGLRISERAHLVLPHHRHLDRAREAASDNAIGTTGRGIGPCYAEKMHRSGIRVCDLFDRHFEARLARSVEQGNRQLQLLHRAEPLALADVRTRLERFRERVAPFVTDTAALLNDLRQQGKRVLFEGAQGALLDIDHGTYPYVTSSNASICGLSAGTGLPPRSVDRVLGIFKAYVTRVGSGPFPTELNTPIGEELRERGQEFGATTGRPRRTGWFDLVAARYAIQLCGIEVGLLTKLDILSGLQQIQVATAYRLNGQLVHRFPARMDHLEEVEPVYEALPGWEADLGEVTRRQDLPGPAREYVSYLEDQLEIPFGLISVGPRRSQLMRDPGVPLWNE